MDVVVAQLPEIGPFRDVLPDEFVGVLDRSLLPRGVAVGRSTRWSSAPRLSSGGGRTPRRCPWLSSARSSCTARAAWRPSPPRRRAGGLAADAP